MFFYKVWIKLETNHKHIYYLQYLFRQSTPPAEKDKCCPTTSAPMRDCLGTSRTWGLEVSAPEAQTTSLTRIVCTMWPNKPVHHPLTWLCLTCPQCKISAIRRKKISMTHIFQPNITCSVMEEAPGRWSWRVLTLQMTIILLLILTTLLLSSYLSEAR